jgi:hypothetical protein
MSKLFATKPCKHCPWKRSSKAGGEDIPNFDIELMRGLAITAPPERREHGDKDDFRKIFACHDSREGKECACAGYVARDGRFNLSLRLLAIQSSTNLRPIIEESEKYELYDNFHEMLFDYEQAHDENESPS